jgi:hypothetical protein
LIVKCGKCERIVIPKWTFWISKIDAFGFLILSAMFIPPIWGISYALEEFTPLFYFVAFIIIAFYISEQSYKLVGFLLAELVVDAVLVSAGVYSVSLFVSTAFALTFYRIGRRVYGLFFKFVNYKLTLVFKCTQCKQLISKLKYPNDSSE